ncbi:hypothetical protein H1R20_g14843, partial [Candolleomyces eurysporus]
MPLASHGALRATGRKAANAIRSSHPHSTNGQGSGGTSARALHISAPSSATHGQHLSFGQTIIHSLEQIRPRTPPNKLFSTTRNFVTTIFTRLSAPGLKVPFNVPHRFASVGNRSLASGLANPSIRNGLSLPARHAIHNKAFGAGTFLPRAPFAPRPPIATQVGLGTARNFSTGRPIFQNIVDNVPIALRSLYEADLDVDFARKKAGSKRPLYTALNKPKGIQKMKAKPTKANKPTLAASAEKVEADKENVVIENAAAELEHYFRAPTPPAVTTLVFIPLAPTPTNRLPLATRDAMHSSRRLGSFIPVHEVGALHASHNTHALRVSTLFARLDQANVWAHSGVSCSAYSGNPRKVALTDEDDASSDDELEGVCTFLKLEFAGWTLAEVRGVIGESGQGWCIFEEIWRDELREDGKGMLSEEEDEDLSSELDSHSSSCFSPQARSTNLDSGMQSPVMDPSQSFIMPTLDFSSSFLGQSAFAGAEQSTGSQRAPKVFECDDPWVEDGYSSSSDGLISRSSSSSSLGLIIDPPSENGWYASASSRFESNRFHSVISYDDEPRERLF